MDQIISCLSIVVFVFLGARCELFTIDLLPSRTSVPERRAGTSRIQRKTWRERMDLVPWFISSKTAVVSAPPCAGLETRIETRRFLLPLDSS